MNKNLIGLISGLGLLTAISAWHSYDIGTYTVDIKPDQFQSMVDYGVQRYETNNHKIHVDSVVVDFLNDRMHIDASVSGSMVMTHGSGTVHATGIPSYNNGAIYFKPTDDMIVDNIKIGQDSDNFVATKKALYDYTHKFAEKHELTGVADTVKEDFRRYAASHFQDLVKKELTSHPIYTFKGPKGFIISSALEKVTISDNMMHITFSATQDGLSILIGIACLIGIAALVVMIFVCPEILMIFAVF